MKIFSSTTLRLDKYTIVYSYDNLKILKTPLKTANYMLLFAASKTRIITAQLI